MRKMNDFESELFEENVRLKADTKELMTYYRALDAIQIIRGICPKCKDYALIDGYVCFGCGYDPTDTE